MDKYPIEYTFQPSPLVFIQGLGKDGIPQGSAKDLKRSSTPVVHNPLLINADKISRKLETVRASSGLELVSLFNKYSLSDDNVWDDDLMQSQIGAQITKYRIKFIDNEFLLPRFSNDQLSTESSEEELSSPKNNVTSPLSPFNESSDLFPDGIVSANWIQKYKDIIPSVFVSVHELDADTEDLNQIATNDTILEEEIKYLRDSVTKHGIKFLSIIVCSRSIILNPDLMERISHIKKLTGLQNRNSLLFLPSGTEKELKTFVSQTISLIKVLSLEFYNNVEKKIKRKKSRQSSAQLSQIPQGLIQPFWEARYFVKLALIQEFKFSHTEQALKFWEQSYASLLEIFKSFPKEHHRWNEFRMLLDFILYHIVRCTLYMEDANLAFARFDTHIQNVIDFLKIHNIIPKSYLVLTWLNYQFCWFLGLLEYVPKELIPVDIPYEITDKSRLSMPNAGYLYLQAVSLTEKRKLELLLYDGEDYVDTYMSLPIENEREFNYNLESINLLKKLLVVFSKSENFKRTENYIKYEIAEFLYLLENYEEAIEQYEECYDFHCKEKHFWKDIEYEVVKKIYECFMKLNNNKKTIEYLFKLSIFPQVGDISVNILPETMAINLEEQIFDAEFFFQNSNIPISEYCQAQLSLKPKVHSPLMELVELKTLELEFEENSVILPILLEHDAAIELKEYQLVELEEKDGKYVGKANTLISSPSLVFHFKGLKASKVGRSSLKPKIKVTARVQDKVDLLINVNLQQKLPTPTRYLWYSVKNDVLHKDFFKIANPFSMVILPRRPKVVVSIENDKTYYLGESLSIPIQINNDDEEDVNMSIEAVVEFPYHWNENDNEGQLLKINSIPSSTSEKRELIMNIPSDVSFKSLKFSLKTLVIAGDTDIPIEDTISVNINIVLPLKTRLTILPRYRQQDMPTPFVHIEETIPTPTRYWCARENIVANNEVEIVDSILTVNHPEEFITELNSDDKKINRAVDEIVYDEFFSTKSNDGIIHRNIMINAFNTVTWKRVGSDTINEFKSKNLELNLPLFDPRVLLLSDETEDGLVHLQYIIENPAPRIFQFTTALTDNDNQVVRGDLKNNSFPVLPFTRQHLNYYLKLSDGDKLPKIKIYDLQYKVYLPILPVNDKVKLDNDGFIYVKEALN